MRDFRFQAIVDSLKTIKNKQISVWGIITYWWAWIRPTMKRKAFPNKMFDLNDFAVIRSEVLKMGKFDPKWFSRIFEPQSRGVRAWEYGVMMQNMRFNGKRTLDVGVGNSRLPNYLSHLGAKVTATDIELPLEETESIFDKRVKFRIEDMTKMKLRSRSFDNVICISAIEHVEMKGGKVYFREKDFEERAIQSIKEMIRVLKKKGVLYLTTDFYLEKQKSDNWDKNSNKIHGAFRFDFAQKILDTLSENNMRIANKPELTIEALEKSSMHSNYRGRYFTTIAFLARKH